MTIPLRFDQLDQTRQSAIRANIAKMQQAGESDDQITDYLVNGEHLAPLSGASPATTTPGGMDIHQQYQKGLLAGRMARENANDADQAAAETPSYAERALGGIASLARDIPGAEALQAGARSMVRGESYGQALNDIRGAEASSGGVGTFNRVAGGLVGAGALPSSMSGAAQGAAYGAASGALQSDPNAGIGQRITDAGLGAAIGGATGKIGESVSNAVRSLAAKKLADQQAILQAVRQRVDAKNYGMAVLEGYMNGGTSPAVQAALNAPDIAPYADIVRQSRTMGGADDATILREAYKLMSERQGNLGTRILNADDFKAGSQIEQNDIGAAKDVLKSAAATQPDPLMPSFPGAIDQHAAVSALSDANKQGSSVTRALMSGKQPSEKNLLNAAKSPDEFLRTAVPNMTPDEAEAALHGVLGRTKDYLGARPNPFTGFGVGSSLVNAGRVAPLVNALDQQMGPKQPLMSLLGPQPAGPPLGASILRALLTSQGHPSP